MPNNDRGQSLISKYVWVIDTILSKGKISFKDLNKKWLDSSISRGVEIPKRTFDNWRSAIADMFGIDIVNENCGEYCYYIENVEDITGNGLRSWLYSTFSVGNTLSDCQSIKDRILLENVPSGQVYLQTIVEAIKANRVLNITYQGYFKDEESSFDIQPYCIKLFRQRWYLVAHGYLGVRIYSLDRIRRIDITNGTFEMPAKWNANDYFDGSFGIITTGKREDILAVKLKVSASQSNYIRSLPLHESQQELERNDEYSIFCCRLRATYDFMQELLRNGDEIEVLEPQSLRDEIKDKISAMAKKYK